MARIKNIELPGEKHVFVGLTAIYGIGNNLASILPATSFVLATPFTFKFSISANKSSAP